MRKWIFLLLLAASGTGAAGCAARGSYTAYATSDRYAPTVYTVDRYPGWLWVDGQWREDGYGRAYEQGYWVRSRPGYVYVPGYYHPRSHIWLDGQWVQRGGGYHAYVRMNGHRYNRPPPRVRVRVRGTVY